MVDSVRSEKALFETGVAAAPSHRDVIEATGPDAAEYLHGQLSQDVTGLAVGSSVMTLLLQPQGKIAAWMRLSRHADDRFWLDVEAGFGQVASDRLTRFKLRIDCELELSTREITAVRGSASAAAIAALTSDLGEGVVVLPALWPGTEGFDVFAPLDSWSSDAVPVVTSEALDRLRIRLGIPSMGRELDESTIPAAAGIVDRSVDFTKGCYVGQELVARIDSRGSKTPSRLAGVVATGSTPLEVGSTVTVDDKEAGVLTSVAVGEGGDATRALLYVKRAVHVPARGVALDVGGSPVVVDLVELPFP